MMTKGGCLCGAVTYTVAGELRPVVACHCTQCRKTTGHYVSATSAHRDHINIQGDVTWFQSSDTARRGFCATCGSNLFWDGQGVNMSIMAGTLDGATGLKTRGHIFCADKGDYYDLLDDLPKYDGADDVMTTQVKP
ncbi:MAG: GFA family protein [Planktomarina sp.]